MEKENAREGCIVSRIIEKLELKEHEMKKKMEKQDVLYAQENKGQDVYEMKHTL